MPRLSSLLIPVLALAAVVLTADVSLAQLPWRGHYMRRDGLFHVERAHWGGGVTASGASVLNTGITAFAPIVGSFVGGRELDARDLEAHDRDLEAARTRSLNWQSDYTDQLRRANDLLDRTARLAGDYGVGEQSNGGTPAVTNENCDEDVGPNPWNTGNRSIRTGGTNSRGFDSSMSRSNNSRSTYDSRSTTDDRSVSDLDRNPWRIRRP